MTKNSPFCDQCGRSTDINLESVEGHENLCRDCFKKKGIKEIDNPNEGCL
jgi:NMD protein affecting ribosome stability and mRNA decay